MADGTAAAARLAQLQEEMARAVAAENYVRAGALQAQLQSLPEEEVRAEVQLQPNPPRPAVLCAARTLFF